jgi:hypothetical protein
MKCIITGLFKKHSEADLVIEHLVQEFHISRERIQIHAFDAGDAAETRSPQDSDPEVSLRDLGLPEETVRDYEQGMHDGGILVAAWVGDPDVGRVLNAYREYGAADPNVCDIAGSGKGEG